MSLLPAVRHGGRVSHGFLRGVVGLSAVLISALSSEAQVEKKVDVGDVAARLAKLGPAPRFYFTKDVEARVRANMAADADLKRLGDFIQAAADNVIGEPLVEYKLEGRRLLGPARDALRRTTYLATAYRLTGDRKYSDRGIRELNALTAFKDFHPSHFLDTAESTASMAIGLDSFDDQLDPATRTAWKRAVIDKGIMPSFENGQWWIKADNNWNQVCHGGLVMGAIAIADVDPALAAKVIARAVECLPYAMVHYGPDGAYPEGPGYWDYGTSYNVMVLSAMENALGTDFGLSGQPGFLATADYFLHATGPTGLYFNYSDCGQRRANAPSAAMAYFAARRGDPSVLQSEEAFLRGLVSGDLTQAKARDRVLPYMLAWAAPKAAVAKGGVGGSTAKLPLTHWTGGGDTPVAFHRTGWTKDATYVAIKAGSAAVNHAHMDAGTFVIDAGGVRWADDLGMQEYHSLESRGLDLWNRKQESQRWKIFRLSAMAHNVLTVDGRPHVVDGKATIVKSTPDRTVVDLTPVYAGQLAANQRGVMLRGDGSVLLQDEVRGADGAPVKVRWAMLTRAEATLDGNSVVLNRDGKSLRMVATGAEGLTFEEYSTKGPNDFDVENPGTRMVGFEVTVPAGQKLRWRVEFLPGGTEAVADDLRSLMQW